MASNAGPRAHSTSNPAAGRHPEVAASTDTPWVPPDGLRERLGYGVAACNLLGSVLYTIASVCYFCRAEEHEGGQYDWEYAADEWGVRFGYALGSAFFIVAALLSFPEVISDD